MTNRKYYLVLLIILLNVSVANAENKLFNKQSDEPMEITSSRMEAFSKDKLVVFSGNAIVKQGNKVLKADKLLLYYKGDSDKKNKIGKIEIEKTGDLEKLEAKGNVSLSQGDRVATGNDAVYFRDSGKVILTGNAVLSEGKSSIKGDRVIIFINENRGVVEGTPKKQIKAVIYPQEKKKEGMK